MFWKGGVPMALTPAMEDYLEAILMIKQQHGYVRCVDVAEQLGVKKPSVSRAVKELSKSGHLVKNADGTLSLTETGQGFLPTDKGDMSVIRNKKKQSL